MGNRKFLNGKSDSKNYYGFLINRFQPESTDSNNTWEVVDAPLPPGWEEKEDNLGRLDTKILE